MIKKYIILVIMVLGIGTAMADMDMGIYADSGGGDITITTNPNSGDGETTYVLNGVNLDDFGKTVTYIPESVPDGIDYYFQSFYNIFMTYNHGKHQWEITPIASLERFKLKFRMIFDYYFVPRTEVIEMINAKEAEINQLRLEIMAIQELIPEEDLCQARINVVKKLNLTSVACGDTVYYNHIEGDNLIGLTEIIPEEVIIEEEPKQEEEFDEIGINVLDAWEKMCLKGLNKFCNILANYYVRRDEFMKNQTEEKI